MRFSLFFCICLKNGSWVLEDSAAWSWVRQCGSATPVRPVPGVVWRRVSGLVVTLLLIKFDGLNGLCVCRPPSVYWPFTGLNWEPILSPSVRTTWTPTVRNIQRRTLLLMTRGSGLQHGFASFIFTRSWTRLQHLGPEAGVLIEAYCCHHIEESRSVSRDCVKLLWS